MLAHGIKDPAQIAQAASIQAQFAYRDTANGRQRHDFRVVITPYEVIVPFHRARMKERNELTAQRIDRVGLDVFVAVAALARQGQVLRRVLAVADLRDNVFHGVGLRTELLWCAAVFADAVRPSTDFVLGLLADLRQESIRPILDSKLLHHVGKPEASQPSQLGHVCHPFRMDFLNPVAEFHEFLLLLVRELKGLRSLPQLAKPGQPVCWRLHINRTQQFGFLLGQGRFAAAGLKPHHTAHESLQFVTRKLMDCVEELFRGHGFNMCG
jgi:hypothetical protein